MDNLKDDSLIKFQVTILFYMDQNFMPIVPAHRTYINALIEKGVIDYYAVSMEAQRTWIIMNATDKKEVEEYLKKSPLFPFWVIEIHTLFVYDAQAYRLPALQFN